MSDEREASQNGLAFTEACPGTRPQCHHQIPHNKLKGDVNTQGCRRLQLPNRMEARTNPLEAEGKLKYPRCRAGSSFPFRSAFRFGTGAARI